MTLHLWIGILQFITNSLPRIKQKFRSFKTEGSQSTTKKRRKFNVDRLYPNKKAEEYKQKKLIYNSYDSRNGMEIPLDNFSPVVSTSNHYVEEGSTQAA